MELFGLVGAILFSVLSAGGVILGLSSWLGKVWADRILEREKTDLLILKETILKEHNEKIATYKAVIDLISKTLSELDKWVLGDLSPEKAKEAYHVFNEQRLKVYGYLAMIASQKVMDTQDALMDKILHITQAKEKYIWAEVRELALAFLNEVRKDIAINKEPIYYKGESTTLL